MAKEEQQKFEFMIDEEYVNHIIQGVFEAEFTNDDWEELFERIGDPIYCAVYDTVQDILGYRELLERNKNAEKTSPHYILKYKHPNAYVYDWKQIKQCFKSETDAQAYIDYGRPLGVDEEWKIEQIN